MSYFVVDMDSLSAYDVFSDRDRADNCCLKVGGNHRVLEWQEFNDIRRERYLGMPMVEATESDYEDALGALPPIIRGSNGDFVWFILGELYTSVFGWQYVSYRGRFFKKLVDTQDEQTLVTAEFVDAFLRENS